MHSPLEEADRKPRSLYVTSVENVSVVVLCSAILVNRRSFVWIRHCVRPPALRSTLEAGNRQRRRSAAQAVVTNSRQNHELNTAGAISPTGLFLELMTAEYMGTGHRRTFWAVYGKRRVRWVGSWHNWAIRIWATRHMPMATFRKKIWQPWELNMPMPPELWESRLWRGRLCGEFLRGGKGWDRDALQTPVVDSAGEWTGTTTAP